MRTLVITFFLLVATTIAAQEFYTGLIEKEGEYEIIYRLRYNGKEKKLVRKVYVFKQTNSYKISTLMPTNKPVSVEFKSNIYNFSHVICPNATVKYSNSFTYNTTTNAYIYISKNK